MAIKASTVVEEFTHRHVWLPILIFALFLIVVSRYNFLLFHTMAELFAIVIAILIYVVAWQSHPFSSNNFLMALACGYFWIGCLDSVHTLTYEGFVIFPVTGANTATQFWVATRYFEALILLTAPFFIDRSLNRGILFSAFGAVAAGIYAAVMTGNFPDAFVEGSGLTPFKIYSEYLIIGVLGAALAHLVRRRAGISDRTFVYLAISIVLTMGAELAFTYYVSVFGLSNLVGHIFKIVSYWLLFLAVAGDTMIQPYMDLKTEMANHAQATAALRQSEALFRAVVNYSPTKIHIKDVDGRYMLINKEAAKLFGVTDEEGLGKTSHDLFPKEVADAFMAHDRTVVVSGDATEEEEEFILDDGVHTYLTVKFPIYDLGGVTAVGAIGTDITESKKVERKLLDARHRTERILLAAGEGIFGIDADGKTTFVNPAAARILGRTQEELIGKNQHDMIHHTKADGSPYPVEECPVHSVLKDGAAHQVSGEIFWRKDGGSFPVEYVSTPVQEDGEIVGAVVVFRDITEHQRAVAAVLESETLYRALVEVSPDAIFVHVGNRIVFANGATAALLGAKNEKDLIGKQVMEFVHPDYLTAAQARIARLNAGEEIPFREFKFLRVDGGTVDVEVTGRALKWKGVAAVQVIARDVGERKRSQEKLREITERDRQHVSQLERVLRTTTVAEMAAALAHQLNQPLSAVGNYSRASVRILESGKWTEDELKETLGKVIQQTDRAASIVRHIADFIGESEGDAAFGDINGIMRAAAGLLKSEIDSHRINLVLDLSRDVVKTRIVAIEIEQAILNLAMNSVDALKAKKRGKRELTMRTAIDGDGAIRISVLDTGAGIPPEVLPNLFRPFMSTKPGGMGMGLAISRTIVEKHQGRIWAGKNGRRGAAFHFTLPVSGEASADGP